jgi:predicted nucleotidyltransferase
MKPDRRLKMRSVFTNFVSSQFVDQAAVVEALRSCARQLMAQCADVVGIYLFGSFATGSASPRNDADVAVEIHDADANIRRQVRDAAMNVLLSAPVPVDLFVISSIEFGEDRGVAGCVAREGVRLG